MTDFDLEKFLKNYKSKKLDFGPYLRCKKLKNYHQLKNSDRDKLIPGKTYVKYVKIGDAFKDNNYNDHIKCGGILIFGGIYVRDKFRETDDYDKWTHLMIKFDPSPKINNDNKIERSLDDPLIFVIKLTNCYVFYKFCGNETTREYFKRIQKKV